MCLWLHLTVSYSRNTPGIHCHIHSWRFELHVHIFIHNNKCPSFPFAGMSTILRQAQTLAVYRPCLGAMSTTASIIHCRQSFPQKVHQCQSKTAIQFTPVRNFSYSATITNIYDSIASSTPVHYLQQNLIQIHDVTGLPWWATIVLSTVLLRSVLIPLSIYQNKIMARLEMINMEMPAIVEELKKEATIAAKLFKWDEVEARRVYNYSLRNQRRLLIERDNCHPLKSIIVLWVQIPLWICQSVAIRNLVNMFPNPESVQTQLIWNELTTGGFGWIPNLTVSDASLILPVTLAVMNLAIIDINILRNKTAPNTFQKAAAWIFGGVSVAMIPVASWVPSCLVLYWTTSSATALAQNLLLMSPKFKQLTGIPTNVSSHLENPYKHIYMKFKEQIHTGREFIFRLKKSEKLIHIDDKKTISSLTGNKPNLDQ